MLRSLAAPDKSDHALDPLLGSVLQEMPVEARIVIPFTPLAKFTAHEQYRLARMGI
ncbi:MAG: hypothetical protein M3436_14885 [Pseudomonadota bacterium]|nr:hypothetical protein [Pseudomonadota bacterium]